MIDIITKIRKGDIDINNQDLFFSILIKGLLLKLDKDINIRSNKVPHFILHTGDDTMYLNMKGYDFSTEPEQISNENYIYNKIPRCIVNPGNIDLLPDQLSSPYSIGNLQYESEDKLYSLSGEFRRMPIKLTCDLKYYVDSYSDVLALIQQIISKLSFIQTYDITYMGQYILCSYKIPDGFQEEHTMDIDGTTSDSKLKTLSLSIEIETSFPVWNNKTIVDNNNMIIDFKIGSPKCMNGENGENDYFKIYKKEDIINNPNYYETT